MLRDKHRRGACHAVFLTALLLYEQRDTLSQCSPASSPIWFRGTLSQHAPPTPFSLLFPFLFHLPVQGLFRGRGPPLPLLFLFPFFPLTALLGLFALARETIAALPGTWSRVTHYRSVPPFLSFLFLTLHCPCWGILLRPGRHRRGVPWHFLTRGALSQHFSCGQDVENLCRLQVDEPVSPAGP